MHDPKYGGFKFTMVKDAARDRQKSLCRFFSFKENKRTLNLCRQIRISNDDKPLNISLPSFEEHPGMFSFLSHLNHYKGELYLLQTLLHA